MIREYNEEDIQIIESIGNEIKPNYKFEIGNFSDCVVYVMDKSVVAFVIYSMIYERAEIVDVAVLTNLQGNNIGSQLLKYVLATAKNKGCEEITLEVKTSNNKAISFYRRHGFSEVAKRKGYYQDGEDALLMLKSL